MSNTGTHHNQSFKIGQDLVVNTNSLSKMKLPEEVGKRTDSAGGFLSDQIASTTVSQTNNQRRKAQDRRATQQLATNHTSSQMSSQIETPGSGNYLQNYHQPLDDMHGFAEENVNEEELALWTNSASQSSIVPGTPSQQQVQTPSQAFISPNITKFKQNLLKTLQKFAKVHTQQKGAEELKILMTTDITDNERMIMFLSQLAEVNEHMNLGQMKEQIKQFGVAAEIFEDALVPFIPRILSSFQKKIKDESTVKLHAVISEALGQLQWHVLGRVEDPQEQLQLFEQHFQKFAFGMIEKTKSRNVQCGALACLTKIIVNCPDEILFEKFEEITDKMCEIVRSKNFMAHQQFLESLISLIFHIQIDFKYYYEKFLPYLIEQIQKSKDAQTTRVAIDALYSIGAHLKEEIVGHIDDLLPILNVCRVDKNQPVRAAAQETIKLFKELKETVNNPDYDEDQISNEDFQQDLIQDNDMLQNLNDSTQHYEKKAPSKLKGSSQTATISHVGELPQNDGIANSENLYPSFAELQSSSEQTESNKIQKKTKQIQNKKHDYLKRNKSRQESNTSRSQIDGVAADPDHHGRTGTKQRVKALQQTTRCKSPSMSQNLTTEPHEQSQLMVIESNRSKSRTKADYRRGGNDSQLQLKNSKQKSQAKLADSVSPNRLGSPKRAVQEGKSQRSQMKGNTGTNITLDASMDNLHTQQEMLLNPNYLKDKSIKKVSIATLKRRMNQQKTLQSPEKISSISRGQENQPGQSSLRQHINSMREANSKLGIRGKQYGLADNEYDQVPQSQKNGDAKQGKRGNFLDKLNPNFMNKFNDQPQGQLLKNTQKKNAKKRQSSDDEQDHDDEDDVPITIVSSKQPVDIDSILEMQRIAEMKYQQQLEEEEEKYRGLSNLEKRKKIIADTQLLQSKEGKGDTKKIPKSTKAKDKSIKKKQSLTQRPKWQNIIDDEDEESDSNNRGENPSSTNDVQRDSLHYNPKNKKTIKKNQTHRQPYEEVEEDQEQNYQNQLKQRVAEYGSQNEDNDEQQIIIKTDKNSQKRTNKIDRNQNSGTYQNNNLNNSTKNANGKYGSTKQDQVKKLQNDDFWRPSVEDEDQASEGYNNQQSRTANRSKPPTTGQSQGIAWLSQSQMPPSQSNAFPNDQPEADTAGSVSGASIHRSLRFKTDNFTNDSLIINNQQPSQHQFHNNDGSAHQSNNMQINKQHQEFDPNSSQFMLDNSIKVTEPVRSPPYSGLNEGLTGMQIQTLYNNQNSNNKFQQELEQKIMMQIQLQQSKLNQNIDLMNSKFEMVISKLDSIQNNYDRLDRQQKEMQIQLSKQQQSTSILSDCYKTLLQNPSLNQINGTQQTSSSGPGTNLSTSPPPQLSSARLPPGYTSSTVFAASNLNENISLSELLSQLNNDKQNSSASGADSQQQQNNQDKQQQIQDIQSVQNQQQIKDQQKSDLEQLSALIGKINSGYGPNVQGIQQSQQLLNHEIASVNTLSTQQQQQQQTQNDQAIQLRKLQESLDLVNAINGRNSSTAGSGGSNLTNLTQNENNNNQLLNALLISQQLQQQRQQQLNQTPSHYQSLDQLQNNNQINSNFNSTSQINDYLKNNLKYL